MKPLTHRQQQVLDAIRGHLENSGRAPTLTELARALGLRAHSAVLYHLRTLERKQAIRLLGGSRGIELLQPNPERSLPLLGRVPAGPPSEAIEHTEARVAGVRELFPEADYLLRVEGESMREAGILDGDLIAVRRIEEARHGDIVVARLNGEDTVKRLYHRDGRVLLVPENAALAPITVDPERDAFAIDGVVVGVIRRSPGR